LIVYIGSIVVYIGMCYSL